MKTHRPMRYALEDWGAGPSEPARGARRTTRIAAIMAWLLFAAASIAIGARHDALLTLVCWGAVGLAMSIRKFWLDGMSLGRAAAFFCSIGLVGAGMSLTAYGVSQCGYESILGRADGSTVGICYGRTADPLYIATGFGIGAVGLATMRLIKRGASWSGFLKGFLPLVAAIFLVDPGGGAIFLAPVTLPGLAWLTWRSRSLVYRIVCVVLFALTVAEVAWIITYSPAPGR